MRVRCLWGVLCLSLSACTSVPLETVEKFRAATKRGDFETAREYLSDDPRIWWTEKSGPGSAWKLSGGRWAEWDDHFRGRGEILARRVFKDRIEFRIAETNDYYLLTERGPQTYLRTYFIDAAGRISGTMVSTPPDAERSPGRAAEFDTWLLERYPEEHADLRPGGKIDPTGDRAPRTRAKLLEWRREVGLPEIENASPFSQP